MISISGHPHTVKLLFLASIFINIVCLLKWHDRSKCDIRLAQRRTWIRDKSNMDATAARPSTKPCPSEFMVQLPNYGFRQKAQIPSKENRTDYTILILTPFSDSIVKLQRYFQLLCSLTYPHEKITVAVGEDSSRDVRTFDQASALALKLRYSFSDVTVFKLMSRDVTWSHRQRHSEILQFARRSHLASARNELLFRTIKADHDWVLWLDGDLSFIPANLIELLLSPKQPIVAPLCVMGQPFSRYDMNTWRETNESRGYIKKQRSEKGDDFLMLEGYRKSKRIHLADLRREGTVVPIDGVGGCALLVNASCHRRGLVFPSFAFDSHIETEGLAKMAAKMGIPIFGLPYVNIFHFME